MKVSGCEKWITMWRIKNNVEMNTKDEGMTVGSNDGKPHVKCRCKRVVIEYFVAVTPNGDEIEIRGIDKKDLKEGAN